MNPATSLLIATAFLFFAWKSTEIFTRKRRGPFPPGPKPKLLIGNALDLPATESQYEYIKWGKRYNSNILYAYALGNHIVILNKLEDAEELLDRRASNYSSRPVIPMVEMMGWGWNVALLAYDDKWRLHRKICQQAFRPDAVRGHHPVMLKNVHKMLRNLVKTPEKFEGHNKILSIAFAMGTMYGLEVESFEDPCVVVAERNLSLGPTLLLPGATLINNFPILKYIPTWFPGASARKLAAKVRSLSEEMERLPLAFVKKSMEDGTATPSMVSEFLEKKNTVGASKEEEQAVMNIAMTAYAGGAETTNSTVLTFFYAIATNPEVQRKAQEEIDRVIGSKRLPGFEDRASLPYIEAIYREVFRLRPAVPMGVGRTASEDDYYKGYFIPKGAILLSNIWAMTRDEEVYHEPHKFNPDRFFDENGKLNDDDRVLAFGFGKRVCVGKHVASATTWLIMVSVLASFSLGKAKDKFGNDIEINDEFEDCGVTEHKKSFQCSIVPRSPMARQLVENTTLEDFL